MKSGRRLCLKQDEQRFCGISKARLPLHRTARSTGASVCAARCRGAHDTYALRPVWRPSGLSASELWMISLPPRIRHKSDKAEKGRRSPAHRAWVRLHACCGCGSTTAIECAHVRSGTGGGTGIKPSDKWCVSLCKECHTWQHRVGEATFEREMGINLKALAAAFFKASPHRQKLEAV